MTTREIHTSDSYVPVSRVLVATTVGNLVEWYDYILYALLAPVFATLFFPNSDRSLALLATFAIYAVSFLVRPLASLFWGALGDKLGRRIVLSSVILLMGVSTFAIGLLPTYAQVGILAPILLLICRVLQGIGATGEWVGSLSFLLEHVPSRRRGTLMAINCAATVLPAALAALLLFLIRSLTTPADYLSWGWRIPFFIGGVLALVGLYIRSRLDETPAFRVIERTKATAARPVRSCLTEYPKQMAAVFATAGMMALSVYSLLTYTPTYLAETVGLKGSGALLSFSAAVALLTLMIPVLGLLGDRLGRKPLLIGGTLGIAVSSIPGYLIINTGGTFSSFLGQALIMVGTAAVLAGGSATMVEIFPTRVRATGGTISQTLAYTIFGGTAALVSQALVSGTGSNIAPAYYLTVYALIYLLIAIWLVPETYRLPLLREEDVTASGQAEAAILNQQV